ncbi:MAG: transglutaminase domain-containing protein [Spirochaetales bacterium]|nr:transglutaminase domain-containing protein [Spirochaetales bacterium]
MNESTDYILSDKSSERNVFCIVCNLLIYEWIYILVIKVFALPVDVGVGIGLIACAVMLDLIFCLLRVRSVIRMCASLLLIMLLFAAVYLFSVMVSGTNNHNIFDTIVYYFFRDALLASVFIVAYFLFDSSVVVRMSLMRYVISLSLLIVIGAVVFRYDGDIENTIFKTYFRYSVNAAGILLLVLLRHLSFHFSRLGKQLRLKHILIVLASLLPVFIFLFTWTLPDHIEKKSISGGLFSSDLFSFDFSNYVELKDKIEIADKRVLILEVENLSDNNMDMLYLKRFALEQYTANGNYKVADKNADPLSPPNSISNYMWVRDSDLTGINQIQTMYLLNINSGTLLGSELMKKVVPMNMSQWQNSPYKQVYKVHTSLLQNDDYIDIINCKGQEKFFRELSYNRKAMLLDWGNHDVNARIHDLAVEITDEQPTFAGKVDAVREYLQANYLYSLHPGTPANRNETQLNYFLFDVKKGYCTYFAFAMVTMLRSVGIASRVAVGFVPDDENRTLNYYDVRSPHAHAWVEVYFDGVGWVSFDPTSQSLAPDAEYQGIPSQEEDRNSLIESIIDNKNLLTEITDTVFNTTFHFESKPWDFRQRIKRTGVVLFIVVVFIFIVGLLLYRFRMLLSLIFEHDKRSRTSVYYRLFLLRMRKRKMGIGDGESVSEYAQRMRDMLGDDIISMTELYLRSQYSKDYTDEDYDRFVELYKAIKKVIS